MRVVARKGINDVTVQDIADEAGVAKGTIYIYFKSRDEILATTMDGATEQLLEKLSAACQSCRGFRDVLERRVRTQLQHFEENRDFFRMYLAVAEPLGEKRLRKHATYRTYLAHLEELLREGRADGAAVPTAARRRHHRRAARPTRLSRVDRLDAGRRQRRHPAEGRGLPSAAQLHGRELRAAGAAPLRDRSAAGAGAAEAGRGEPRAGARGTLEVGA